MVILYHAPLTRSMRILWLLEELALPYELATVQFTPPTKPFAQSAPGGKLPAIRDGGITMFESGAIVEYLLERYGMSNGADAAERTVRAPMPGLVVRVLVEKGEAVEAGQDVVVLEAMKMENVLRAPAAGTVGAVHVAAGTAVGKSDLLLEID